jgi:MFS family permease
MSMTYAGTLPVLREAWTMSATEAGSISTAFQLGYAFAPFLASALAERAGARRVYLWSLWTSAIAAGAFALFARSYLSGLTLYSLVAVSQGAGYTTAIMLVAERYPSACRGAAVGWLLASASLGYTFSLGLTGMALRLGGYPVAFLAAACGPAIGTLLGWIALRSSLDIVHQRPVGGGHPQTALLRTPPTRRLLLGYAFHSWELLGMLAWLPAFLTAALVASGRASARAVELSAYVSAIFHLIGLIAGSTMGSVSDRVGRRGVLVSLAGTSTVCSFVFGWLSEAPVELIFGLGAIYMFAAVGDSPVLSAGLTETVSPAYLGRALALRSLLGFSAGALAPLAFGAVLDLVNSPGSPPHTWGWSFATLGLGGLAATACTWHVGTRVQARKCPW